MKTLKYKIGSMLLVLGFSLISLTGNSQDNRVTKQDQKEAQDLQRLYNFQVIDSMLQNKSFVLEADYLENQYGERRPVMSDVNFIKVDSSDVVLQTGSNRISGSNGVGGATAEGTVKDLNIVKNLKSYSFWLRFTVVTRIGIYDVDMTIYSNRTAKATISGLTMGKLIYDGRVENLYDSRFYKGMNSL